MPVRNSVFTALAAHDPTYSRMQAMAKAADPILFNLGDSARSSWIEQIEMERQLDQLSPGATEEWAAGCGCNRCSVKTAN